MSQVRSYSSAIALQHAANSDRAPSVAAKGELHTADYLVKLAHRFGIPVVEDPELAQVLNSVEIDQEIPPRLFEAVALLLNAIEPKSPAK